MCLNFYSSAMSASIQSWLQHHNLEIYSSSEPSHKTVIDKQANLSKENIALRTKFMSGL